MQGLRRRTIAVLTAALAAAVAVLGLTPPASAAGGELVIINSIKVENPVFSTKDACRGFVHHASPVIPVTVVATFINFNGDDPVGPYATVTWSGGFGSWDDHFGTAQAENTTQTFHILVRPGPFYYHGAGSYDFTATVQDVGLAGGFAVRSTTVDLPPPGPTTAEVKCDMAQPVGPAYILGQVADEAKDQIKDLLCPVCGPIEDAFDRIGTYNEVLNNLMHDNIAKDPPDPDYQQVAQRDPPPVLPAPASLSTEQAAAYTELVTRLAGDIGTARAISTTINRLWGADNAHSRYWYGRQLTALADFADELAAGLDALPPLWDALKQSFAGPSAPTLTVTGAEVGAGMASLLDGFSTEEADLFAQLGVDGQQQRALADTIFAMVDPNKIPSQDGFDALFANNDHALAGSMRLMAKWARSAVEQAPPLVTRIRPRRIPSSGDTVVTVEGANLGTVTGVNFGPSTPYRGRADIIGCTPDSCQVRAPPGTGTVDVIAIGPGGPSDPAPEARAEYTTPDTPHVTRIYPASGPVGGRNTVAVFGSGLSEGTVYFGPAVADSWRCTDAVCTASVPESGAAGAVDVTVVNPSGTSEVVAAARYTYDASSPPAPEPPSVTAVSPDGASDLGGDRITVTGDHLTNATDVVFVGADSDEYAADDVTVVDDTHLELTAPPAAPGTYHTIVHGPGGVSIAGAADRFTFVDAAPTITGVSPSSGPDIGGTEVTVTGTGLTGASFDIGGGFETDAQCTSTRCTFTTPPLDADAALGPVHVVAYTSDGQSAATAADEFTYTAGPQPAITSVTPDSGSVHGSDVYPGTTVVVYGENLNGGTVSFGGVDGEGVSFPPTCAMTSCVVTTPEHAAGRVDVRVRTHAGTSPVDADATFDFVHLGPPVVTGVSPSAGFARNFDDVVVSGHDLTDGTVYIGDEQASFGDEDCTATECRVAYPPWQDAPGSYDVTVVTPAGTSAVTDDTRYTYYVPEITGISPSSGWTDGSQRVTITGTRLTDDTGFRFGDNYVDASGAPGSGPKDVECEPVAAPGDPTTCSVKVPSSRDTGPVDVVATAPDDTTSSPVTPASRFSYTERPLPEVTGVSPDHGNDDGGDAVTVTGRYLAGGTVRFAETTATTDVHCTDTACTLRTRSSSTDGPVHVTVETSAGRSATSAADLFSYEPPLAPTITAVSPDHGSVEGGTTVRVTGTHLLNAAVELDGTAGLDPSCTDTACTVTTRPHALGTVDVVAQTGGGTSAVTGDTTFTFETPPAPAITSVTPDSGPASGGTAITVTGTDLAGAALTVGGVAAADAECTSTTCTLTQPAVAAGTVHVRATTSGGTSATSGADTFTVERIALAQHAITGVTADTGGGEIVRGPDGDMWFTMPALDEIGRVHADGTTTSYPTEAGAEPLGLALGPDGAMWFTEESLNKIVRIDDTGTQTRFQVPGVHRDIRFLTAGPDGRLWFSLATSGAVGAMTTAGDVTVYHLPDYTVVPYHLVTGADGRVWFTEWGGDAIGAITTDGVVTEYPVPGGSGLLPWTLTSGPDGRLWFTQATGQKVSAIDTHGTVTNYDLPLLETDPQGLTYGADGRMWFVAPESEQVSAFDPATATTTDYPMPDGLDSSRTPKYIGADDDGSLWVTGVSDRGLVHVTGLTSDTGPTLSHVAPSYGGAGTGVVLTGTNLAGATAVDFGGTPATAFTVLDPGHVQATAPAGSGTVDVTVTTPDGTTATSTADRFRYGGAPPDRPVVTSVEPPSGPAAGGTSVTVHGEELAGGTVAFGVTAGAAVSCTATACTAEAPAHTRGTVHVTVTTAGGTSATGDADRYTYLAPAPPRPTVTAISPVSGPTDGGTTVTVTGTDLTDGAVRFGTKQAPTTCTATSCTAIAPSGGWGPVDVRVATAGGTSRAAETGVFTYVSPGPTVTSTVLTSTSTGTDVEVGDGVGLTAKISPSEGTGSVTFLDGTATLGTTELADYSPGTAFFNTDALAVGTHELTARYSGDAHHAASTSAPVTIEIVPEAGKAPTTTTLTATPSTIDDGANVHLVAAVAPADVPGWVTFEDDGTVLDVVEVVDGSAVLDTTDLPVGTHRIVALFDSDDETHSASTSAPVTVTVDATPATTTSVTLTADPATAPLGSPVTLTATVSPPSATGTVRFDLGGDVLGTDALTDGTATLTTTVLPRGFQFVTARYTGDATHAPSGGGTGVQITAPEPPPVTTPGAPGGVHAVAGIQQATVTWTPPASDGGSPVDRYVVTPYRDGAAQAAVSASGSATGMTVTGLAPGASYTFTVAAHNAAGTGPASAASNAVTPAAPPPAVHAPAAPGAPTAGVVARHGQWKHGRETIRVGWSEPGTDGGAAIDHYVVTAHRDLVVGCPLPGRRHRRSVAGTWTVPGGTTATTVSLAGITGRWQGSWYEWCRTDVGSGGYSFTVRAVNSAGTSPESAPSTAVAADWVPDPPRHRQRAHWHGGFPPKDHCVSRGDDPGCASPSRPRAGHKVAVFGSGFRPHEKVHVVLHSGHGVALGTLRADRQGRVHGKVRIPHRFRGRHTLTLKGRHQQRIVLPIRVRR